MLRDIYIYIYIYLKKNTSNECDVKVLRTFFLKLGSYPKIVNPIILRKNLGSHFFVPQHVRL